MRHINISVYLLATVTQQNIVKKCFMLGRMIDDNVTLINGFYVNSNSLRVLHRLSASSLSTIGNNYHLWDLMDIFGPECQNQWRPTPNQLSEYPDGSLIFGIIVTWCIRFVGLRLVFIDFDISVQMVIWCKG